MQKALLTDDEVARLFRVSVRTLVDCLKKGPKGPIDFRKAQPIIIGSGNNRHSRRWPVTRISALIGMSVDDILAAL